MSAAYKTRHQGWIVVAAAVGALALPTGAYASSHASASAAKVKLKYAVVNGPTNVGNIDLMNTIFNRANKYFTITPYYSGVLGPESTEITDVQNGSIDMALITDAALANVDPAMNISELPFFWKNNDAINKLIVENGPIGQQMLKGLSRYGLKGLGAASQGPRDVLSNVPINSLADARGLKVRIVPNDLFTSEWTGWGADPVPVASTEVFTALQTGTVQAVDSNPSGMVTLNWYQSAKYLALTNHEYTVEYLVMNPKKWASLTKKQKSVLMGAITAGEKANAGDVVNQVDAAINTMTGAGVHLTRPNRTSFLPGARKVWAKYKKSIGTKLVNEVLRLQKHIK